MRWNPLAQLFSASLALLPSIALADDPYSEYRIPEHYWRSWTANLMGSGNHEVSDVSFASNSRSGVLNGAFSTQFVGGFDSEPRSTAYFLSLVATGIRSHADENHQTSLTSFDHTDRERSAKQQLRGALTFSRYPWRAPLGLTLGTSGDVTLGQSWHSTAGIDANTAVELHTTSNETMGGSSTLLSLSAGVVWGRVRDATPVYQVQVLEQRLLEAGTIQRPLSPAGRARLASLYTMQSRVGFAHQRPDKYFWRELERLLSEDGALSERGLDAYSVQRLLEPLVVARGGVSRTRGFAFSPTVFLNTAQNSGSNERESSQTIYVSDTLFSASESHTPRTSSYSRADGILTGIGVEYHRPVGPRWQFDGVSSASLTESGETLFSTTEVSATWLVSDRWYANARFIHRLEAVDRGAGRAVSMWQVTYGASVYYFLEDSWALQLGMSQDQSHFSPAYQRQENISLGISYVFSGLLNAPGLFAPMRLSPPSH